MPFDPEFTAIYEKLVKPALEEAGYTVHRADSFIDQRNILQDILRGIGEADLVVAEITIPNPNVFYELGLCHGLRIPTVLISQSIEEIPFDLRSYRIVTYSTQFDKVEEFKEALQDIGSRHKNGEIKFGSPVTDFLPVQNEEGSAVHGSPNVKPIETEEKAEIQDEKGFLDFIVEGSESAESMTSLLNIISEDTRAIGERMNEHTESIQAISDNPGPGSAVKAQKISSIVALDMNNYSGKIDGLLLEYERNIEDFISNYSGYVDWLSPDTKGTKENLLSYRSSIETLLNASSSGLNGTRSFRDAIAGLKDMSISRDMNRACRRLTFTLDKLNTITEKVLAFCTKSLAIIDEKLSQK